MFPKRFCDQIALMLIVAGDGVDIEQEWILIKAQTTQKYNPASDR